MENRRIDLDKGYVLVYDFENVKVHNYNTADYIDDQVILLEKNNKVVVIESPVFYDNNKELENYIKSLGVELEGVLLAYHMGGGTFLKSAKKSITLADIKMNIIPTNEAFDIEIPEINSLYTHMLGSDCHSIIEGVEQANAMIETLKDILKRIII